MADYKPNPTLDASIEAKIDAGFRAGIVFEGVDVSDKDKYRVLLDALGITAEEERYMAEQNIYKMVQVAVGEKFFAAIKVGMAGTSFDQADIIPCLTAYFEASDNLEAAE